MERRGKKRERKENSFGEENRVIRTSFVTYLNSKNAKNDKERTANKNNVTDRA